jgi:hypothetical protein
MTRIARIVSGGQTGVDRAALDVALDLGIDCGGWCPAGRWAEDGRIADRYPLRETPSAELAVRTAWNVRDSDATLILLRGVPAGGTLATLEQARLLGRPVMLVDLATPVRPDEIGGRLAPRGPVVLNVAGPRESESPGIYADAHAFLTHLLASDG